MESSREGQDAREWRSAVLITVVAGVVRLCLGAWLPLFPDETYYWDWSRHLAAGYFDHPPAIAYLIAGGTKLFALAGQGPSAFAVRLLPICAGAVASLFTLLIARRLGGGRAARIAAIVFALMPLAATGLVLATPDDPLLATSAATLYFVVRALEAAPRSRASLGLWCAAGIALGLAFASKYTSILLPLTIAAAVIARPSFRTRLREPGPYVACVLATLVFFPVLHWNATHDWISFRFQLQHGLGTPKGSAIKRELDLIGGQLGLVSPILFVLAAGAVWRNVRRAADDARFALAVVALGSWVFFVYSATRRAVEANWPAPSYIPGVALLAALGPSPQREVWLRRGMLLAAALVSAVYVQVLIPVLPVPARRDPVARSAGWNGLAARVQAARLSLGPRSFAAGERYQEVSELAYHLPGRPNVFCVCVSGRRNQYELWPTFPSGAQLEDNLVLVLDERSGVHETVTRLTPYFSAVSQGELVPLLRGTDTAGVVRIWLLRGYRGGWPARALNPARTAPSSSTSVRFSGSSSSPSATSLAASTGSSSAVSRRSPAGVIWQST